MINNLEVLNGDLELKFNPFIYEYTVRVKSDVEELSFSYDLEDDCYVRLRNNIILEEENTIYLDVYNVDNLVTYTFYVYKDNVSSTIGIDNYMKSLEIVKKEEVSLYKVQLLSIGLFLSLLIVFCIIFCKRKYN